MNENNTYNRMYAIADKHNEGYFYDAKKKEFDCELNLTGLFPSEEVAALMIESELDDDSEIIPITGIVVEENSCFSYSYKDIWKLKEEEIA